MRIELDHVFICTARGAPEAGKFLEFGLREGPPDEHLGQGTANRRFSFLNAMIELLWVSNRDDAQSQNTARTLLWERWSSRSDKACPFGICVRPHESQELTLPFECWEYRPAYLPSPLCLHVGEAGIEEPMWVYLTFMRRAQRERWFHEHPSGVREITRLTLQSPAPIRSSISKVLVEAGILEIVVGSSYLLKIEFDHNRQRLEIDFTPDLPVVFRA